MNAYTRKIRDHINQARQQDVLMRDRGRWFQLTSSLDVLEDAELAIDAYLATTFERESGSIYLATYGLLQALVLQQDAAFHAQEVLLSTAPIFQDFKGFMATYPRLDEIREIRNISIGHPTKADRPKPVRYTYISRISMRHQGFKLLISSDAGDTESRDIAITDLIVDQRRDIADLLTGVVAALEQADAAHREAFKMDRLAAIFEGTMGYMFEKVSEGVRRSELADLGAGAWMTSANA